MAIFKMHQLGNESACNKRREFEYQINETKGDSYHKAVAIKQATKAILNGSSPEKIMSEMETAFNDIPYQKKQREILLNDSYKQINRYIKWETRELKGAMSSIINIYDLMDVEVTPDFIVRDNNPVIHRTLDTKTKRIEEKRIADSSIEIIKLKISKPMPQYKVKSDIGLLSMLLYGRQFFNTGKLSIKASYYYLKRNDDSFGKEPSFKDFDEKQICSLSEIFDGTGEETDTCFKPIIEEFVKGHDEQDIDPKDCEKCILYRICKGYKDGPVSIDRRSKTKANDISLNTLQLEAVEY